MEIGSLGRWYDAGPILTANLGDTANPSWNDFRKHNSWNFLKLNGNLQMNDKIRVAQSAGSKPGTLGTFAGKIAVPGIQRLQIFTKAQIAANI